MQFHLSAIIALLPFVLTAPMPDHLGAEIPTPTTPSSGDVSILPFLNPVTAPPPSLSVTLQGLLSFCASGSPAANLPTVQQFCTLLASFAGAAGGGGLGGELGGILPPIPGLPIPLPLPAGTGPVVPVA